MDPEAAEILACKRASQVAMEINSQRVHVELDSLHVVQMLNQPGMNFSAVGPWIQEIKQLLDMLSEFKSVLS